RHGAGRTAPLSVPTLLPAELLAATGFWDADLIHLRELNNLRSLNLSNTWVTDAGLIHLRGLKQLQGLNLNSADVSDVGLVHLHGLQQLQGLSLYGTEITKEGDAALRKALPKCQVLNEYTPVVIHGIRPGRFMVAPK
ncbi:MAG: hypothetical protein N2C14_20175, partial [Planctomycetales bacterium]